MKRVWRNNMSQCKPTPTILKHAFARGRALEHVLSTVNSPGKVSCRTATLNFFHLWRYLKSQVKACFIWTVHGMPIQFGKIAVIMVLWLKQNLELFSINKNRSNCVTNYVKCSKWCLESVFVYKITSCCCFPSPSPWLIKGQFRSEDRRMWKIKDVVLLFKNVGKVILVKFCFVDI